ncbi:hypothetical protein PMI07_004026 [Rhizobium sp. CF080]|uniref:DUF5677 domain-containing protein n=1 Tax=Rhizobium sp. (strain CF080) TaxID=1144310 RepID=UPI000271788C|nr:DUF5677 domain-containing protein [Rhizobium sp. CF080]EUC00740.1 hypothetical protein PMI07_004026 [Rhizobium sp. CF080]
MFEFLHETYQEAVAHLPKVMFDKRSELHRTIVSLYASIVEQTHDVLILRRGEANATLNIILRATLEAYVDLVNLCGDVTYLGHMKASFHEQWIILGRHGLAGGSPFLQSFRDNPEAAALLQQHKDDLAALAATPSLNAFDRFRKAGMENTYRSIYNNLCNESHNNIRALISRHLRLSDGNQPELVIFDLPTTEDLVWTSSTYLGILVHSTFLIHDYFRTEARPAIEELRERNRAFIEDFKRRSNTTTSTAPSDHEADKEK